MLLLLLQVRVVLVLVLVLVPVLLLLLLMLPMVGMQVVQWESWHVHWLVPTSQIELFVVPRES
jgi:hypothetical protein